MTEGGAPLFPGRAYIGDQSIPVDAEDERRLGSGSRRVVVERHGQGAQSLILTELAYPGWTVSRDGIPVEATQQGLFRAVDCPEEGGKFVWTYRPTSFLYGAVISSVTLFMLAAIGHLKFWHPRFVDRLLRHRSEV